MLNVDGFLLLEALRLHGLGLADIEARPVLDEEPDIVISDVPSMTSAPTTDSAPSSPSPKSIRDDMSVDAAAVVVPDGDVLVSPGKKVAVDIGLQPADDSSDVG